MKNYNIVTFKVDSLGEEGFYLLEKLRWTKESAFKNNGWMKLTLSPKDAKMLIWLCKLTNTPYKHWD